MYHSVFNRTKIQLKDVGEVKSDFSCENETYALEVNSPAVGSFQETDYIAHTESAYTSLSSC